ncbi:hypothetical protein HID58_033410 [Brassica napus]|uniref:F-box domain-containing protein n=1 Tax=Brassica napus TaxID=3708 RepID=A0ABQ8BZ38_BRANA|nr:hypothetical protein HID58_033410 [Brassica napus]
MGISALLDCLITQILLWLPTRYSIKISVLSTRWRNLWLDVPGLDLHFNDLDCFSKVATNNFAVDHRGIQHLDVGDQNATSYICFLPVNIYQSKTLVSLKLQRVVPPKNPEFVFFLYLVPRSCT